VPKVIGKFDPVSNRTFEEAERHYMEVHTQFARKMFRDHGPTVERYVINRAMRQYSVAGHFDQKPRAWRWVINHLGDEFLPERMLPLIWRDHTNVLKNIRACQVEETIVASRLNGQTSTVKFLVEHDRRAGQSVEEAKEFYEGQFLPTLTPLLEDALGFRLFGSNAVQAEAETEDSEEEAQIMTGGFRETNKYAYDEIWFDNEEWADSLFSRPEVYELLQFGPLDTSAYLIDENTGIDRR
jgi:hypothetical protein